MLLAKQLTKLLEDIASRVEHGNRTSSFSELVPSEKMLLKDSYQSLKAIFASVSSGLGLKNNSIYYKVGSYQNSGNAYPHLWGGV